MTVPMGRGLRQRRWLVPRAREGRRWRALLAILLGAFGVRSGRAAEVDVAEPAPVEAVEQTENAAPVVALAATAFGGADHRYGAAALVRATAEVSGEAPSDSRLGGGFRLWGAPLDRLTIMGEGLRRDNGEFAPSLALLVRLFGGRSAGWALGALGRYKAEGFAEVEGEVELALLGSYARGPVYLDLNFVAGRGFEEEETDAEVLVRAGYAVISSLRVGAEGQYRHRFGGDARLPGGKNSDVFAGAELSLSFEPLYAAILIGPTTVGVIDGVGLGGLLTLGGVM